MSEAEIILGVDKDDTTDSTQPHMVDHFNAEYAEDPVDGVDLYRQGHNHPRFEEFSHFFNKDEAHRRLFLHCINVRPRKDARTVLPVLRTHPAVAGIELITGRYHFAWRHTLAQTVRTFGEGVFDLIHTTQYLSTDNLDSADTEVFDGSGDSEIDLATGRFKKLSKLDIYDIRGVTHVVEDLPPHIRDAATSGRQVYIMNQPWNQGLEVPGAERVYSWYEVPIKLFGYDEAAKLMGAAAVRKGIGAAPRDIRRAATRSIAEASQ